jgi:hypothetical protein
MDGSKIPAQKVEEISTLGINDIHMYSIPVLDPGL